MNSSQPWEIDTKWERVKSLAEDMAFDIDKMTVGGGRVYRIAMKHLAKDERVPALNELIELEWDFERLSSSGRKTLEQIYTLMEVP